jgi:hypothetical protein
MAEFAGYVGNLVPPTDWGKIGTELFDKYNKINEDRKVEKEKIDDDFNTTFQKIGEYESTTDQRSNEYLFGGVDQGRGALKTWYDLLKKGAITMSEYKLRKNTLMTDWGNVAKVVKNNAGILEGIQKANASGEMSEFGRFRAEEYANMLQMKDGKLYVNPDSGRYYGTKANPNTGVVDNKQNIFSPVEAVNGYNIVDKKVNLDDGVTKFLKRVSDYSGVVDLGGGKIKVTEDARKNPKYQDALSAQIKAMTVTPFDAASILTDYAGGYKIARSEEAKKELIKSGISEDKVILAERKNGVWTPALTSTQQTASEEYVRDQIEVGIGRKEQMTQGHAPQQTREAKPPTEAKVRRVDLYNKAVGISETFRKDPTNPQVVAEIEGLFPPKSVKVTAARRPSDNEVYGFNVYKLDADGNIPKDSKGNPSVYQRIRIDPDAIYERLTKDNRMGTEYGVSQTAKREWIDSGNDPNRTLFDYKKTTKKPGVLDNK